MSKIVQAVNAMISNPKLIGKVIRGSDDELFFLYKGKYKWSMSRRESVHFLWFYPGDESLDQLASYAPEEFNEGVAIVTYKDTDIGTKEAKASFSELYTLLRERLYGVNAALDDIIGDA